MARRKNRRPRGQRAAPPPTAAGPTRLHPRRALALPLLLAVVLIAFCALPSSRQSPSLLWAFAGAGAALLAWNAALFFTVVQRARTLAVTVAIRKQHYVQACAQLAIFGYWGWYWRDVYAFAYLIAAQLLFAYAFDALLTWSRRDTYTLGFGPFPIIFSINLFLWFKSDWFYLQFLMVAVGFAAKELIRWTKDGRRTHIFNPSSFSLGVFSIVLILSGTTDLTWGVEIATTQLYPQHIYLLIFLVSLPAQFLFGVASMTLAAIGTTYAFSLMYAVASGSSFFVESYIPIAVFLGMHLLFNDPSTSPRTELGRITFGVLYGSSVIALFALLGQVGVPTFYDKLLAVPLLNLLIQMIDRAARSPRLRRLDPAVIGESLSPRRRNLAYMSIWGVIFLGMQFVSVGQVTLARADIMLAQGRVTDSIAHYRELVQREPDNAAAHNKLGYALIQVGQVQEALPLLRRATTLQPGDPEAHNNLGLALMQVGQAQGAVTSMERAVELRPHYSEAHYNLAHARSAVGDATGAVEQFREALRGRPDWATALGALAWLKATSTEVRDPEEAVRLASRASELSEHRDVAVQDALAAAYAAAGRFEEAARTAEAAEALAVATAPALAPGIRARADLYRSGRPLVIDGP